MSRPLKNRRLAKHMPNPSKSTKVIEEPSDEERRAFLDAIPARLFGTQYLFAWNCVMQEYLLVETIERVVDGHSFEAEIVPFN